jgi:virulence factor
MKRLGIIDLDSSHSVEFTRRFNHIGVDRDQCVDGAKVVLAWPGSSEMAPERIPGFQREMESFGIELVDEPVAMLGQIDAVLILSLCGAAHLERARPFLKAGLPTFIDKPFTCSLTDAVELITLAEDTHTPLWNASAMRFSEQVQSINRRIDQLGRVHGVVSYGPSKRADGNPGLFHYGIHAVEVLFQLMGTGCESVTTTWTPGGEVVTGLWTDGRIGTVRGSRDGATSYGFIAFCENAVVTEHLSTRYAYRNLCQQIVHSLETDSLPVSHPSTLEVVRFITAASRSESLNGASVQLDDAT